MSSPTRLTFTRLEDRTVPAMFGVTWPDPQNLTVSFAPDGTDVGGVKSDLVAALDAELGNDVWQGEIRRAFQTWAAVTNINVRVVPDLGIPFGADAQLQACPRVGDIRIASRPLSGSQLAIANPPDLVSGWAGEIVLNSNYQFSAGGANGTYDLYSVVLHEIGHSFGLSSEYALDKSAVMSEDYGGLRTGLSTADITAIQKLYGVREADVYEGNTGNGSLKSATKIDFLATLSQTSTNYIGGNVTAAVVRADITTAKDADVYRVTIPATSRSPVLALTTSSISQLAAKVTVMNSSGAVLLSASASAPGADIWLDLRALPRDGTYYVKVEAARADVFGVGQYRLTVGETLPVATSGIFSTAFSTGGQTLESNNKLSGIIFGNVNDNADARWDAVGKSKLASATDSHTVTLTTKDAANALVVAVWTNGNISPNLRVTDADGKAVAFEVLRADEYATVVQILGVKKGATFSFAIMSGNWKQPSWLGAVNYRFAADFRATPITLATFASGTLTAAAPTAARTFTVNQSQLFRFELTAGSVLPQPGATATLTITDGTGKVVYTLTASAGQTVASDVFLLPGTYTVTITAATTSGSLLPLSVLGRMTPLTDPIGPSLLDPTAPLDPPLATTAPTTTELARQTTTTTDASTATIDGSYFWGFALVDPLRIWW